MAEHGTTTSYTSGCRCLACGEAWRLYRWAWRERNHGRQPFRHDASSYRNYGCRCPVCTAANTEYQRARRTAQRGG